MLGASCQVIHGFEDYRTDTTSGAGAAAQSGGGGGTSVTSGGGDGGMGVGAGGNSVGTGPPPTDCNGGEGVCLATAPDGWVGYVSIYPTPNVGAIQQCPDGTAPVLVYSDPSTAPAKCDDCACSTTFGCNAPLDAYNEPDCNNTANDFTATTSCGFFGSFVRSVITGTATMTNLACEPSGGMPQLQQMWMTQHALCEASVLPGGDCAAGDTCVDRSDALICIKADVNATGCPDGWEMATRIATHIDATDNRECTACSCTPPASNLCTGGTYDFYAGFGGCQASTDEANEGGSCNNIIDSNYVKYVPPQPTSGCMPSGGVPSGGGAVVPGQTTTLCCR